jgi:hypothetical protein
MKRTTKRTLGGLPLVLLLGACGSGTAVSTGDAGDCRPVTTGSSVAQIDRAAMCFAAAPDGTEGCRSVGQAAATASIDALTTASECVLTAQDRSDGAWIAGLLNDNSADGSRVLAILRTMETGFDESLHANSFAAALTQAGQNAVGRQLGEVSAELRTALVSIGLGYSLSGMIEYCIPYADLLPAGHPGFATLADNVDRADGLDQVELMALASSGRWSPQDLVECFDREERGCENWSGVSPLQMLPLTGSTMDANPAPNNAIRRLGHDPSVNADDAAAITEWLSTTEYEYAADSANQLVRLATFGEVSSSIRSAIASNASGPMCEGEMLRGFAMQVADHSVYGVEASHPWSVLLTTCSETQNGEDLVETMASGWTISLQQARYAVLATRLQTLLADVSCSDAVSLAQQIEGQSTISSTIRMASVVVFDAVGERCMSDFESELESIVGDSSQHPDTRLAAGVALARNGNDAGCSRVTSIMNWREPELDYGPGARAEARADELRDACN